MPGRRKNPPDAVGLFAVPTPRRRPPGRFERACADTVRRAQRAGALEDLDGALGAAIRAQGRAVDAGDAEDSPWAVSTANRVLLELLTAAALTPTARTTDDDDAGELARVLELGRAARRDTAP